MITRSKNIQSPDIMKGTWPGAQRRPDRISHRRLNSKLRVMARCTIQITSALALVVLAVTGCVSVPKPSVMLTGASPVTIAYTDTYGFQRPKVMVHPGEEDRFGILDYGTLRAGHAVIDMKQKTITVTR